MSNLTPAERRLGAFSAVSALLWLVLGLGLAGAGERPWSLLAGGITAAFCGAMVAAEPRRARPVLLAPSVGLLAGGLSLGVAGSVGWAALALAWGGVGVALVVAAARSVNGSTWRGGPPG